MWKTLFSLALQWLLGKLGISDAEKLGRAEEKRDNLEKTLKEVETSNEIKQKNNAITDPELAEWVQSQSNNRS